MAQQTGQTQQFYDTEARPFLQSVGSRALNLLNGVKRTTEQFAELYNLQGGSVQHIVDGKIAPTPEFLAAFDSHPAVRLRDLYDSSVRDQFPIKDDTLDGVLITTAEERDATDRSTFRGPEGRKVHFYSYRDTAMSETSLFRPEWISEHYVHDGENPETPDWAFNKGHFEHQMTYFVGPVNFHWIDSSGVKHVRAMNTGDTNYITPFVPHTFTTRREGEGLILAVTYGGAIATDAYQTEIQQMTLHDYLKSLEANIPQITGTLPIGDLGGVLVNYHGDTKKFEGSSVVHELMGDIPFQTHPRALEHLVSDGHPELSDIQRGVERWGYNIGDTPVVLGWAGHSKTLNPGDSFFMQPDIEHSFRGNGKLLVMEIKPEGSNPLEELALIDRYAGQRGLKRVHTENTQWF